MVKGGIFLSNRYEVLSKVGAGGMADVYKGRDCMLNRYVAIKVLKKEYREDQSFVKKFISEAQAAAGLLNPNIVNVYDVGEDRGLYYMVMELVEGITLKDYIQKKGRLSTREVISITIQMCTGIAAAHSHSIIHRDIKPQNIIISKDGKVKVTDFGIAKAITSNTVTSNAMGSVHYVSPEQARGGFCDEKSDIYSVGITMYEMVTGEVPFDGETTVEVAMKHLQKEITPPSEYVPDMSVALEDIILKCTQKSSERRYADCALLIRDLKKALVDPDGDFVEFDAPKSVGETRMVSPDELGKIKRDYKRKRKEDEYEDYEDESYDDEEDEYEEKTHRGRKKTDGVDPSMNKMMKVLTIVAAVIIAFVVLFVAGKAIGLFNVGPGTEQSEVESGEGDIDVPSLVGETKEVAEEMCRKKNLVMEVAELKNSDEYPDGVVIEQYIAAGEKVEEKTVIQVVVSSGAEEVTIEDVSGKTEDEARRILIEQGFKNPGMDTEYSDTVDAGEVIRTEPEAGEKVTVDTEIIVIVSKGAEKMEVPSLIGKTAKEAKRALEDAELTDGGYTEEYSSTVAKGKVISQSVDAGKKVNAGTKVSYVVSKGEKPAEKVSVPPVGGGSLASAKNALGNVGLGYKEVWVDSALEYGTVVEVKPGVGTKVTVGSKVTLYISNGSLNVEEPDDQEDPTVTDPDVVEPEE